MLYKTLNQRYHLIELVMTPSRHLLNWLPFLTSNYDKLHILAPISTSEGRSMPRLADSRDPVLASPMLLRQQTRPHTIIHTQYIANVHYLHDDDGH
jgi:hypothetical protein